MIPYLLNVALMLTGCLCFYKLLLRRETFYKLNRLVLAACLVLSFSLPLIPVPQQWSFWKAERIESFPNPTLQSPAVLEHINESQQKGVQSGQPVGNTTSAESTSYLEKAATWAVYIYWFGVIAFALNFMVQLFLLLYKAYRLPYIQDGKYRIVELKGDEAPCSFGHFIFINPEKYDWETYNQILLHEKIHIQQQHTVDILLAELVLIFQWFNPFAWIYRKEVESNLEFLTDEKLLENPEIDRQSYQMSILKVSAPQLPLSLTTNYNQSLLKKRIAMMNAKKSNMNTSWKYGFIIPMLILFVTLLNKPVAHAQDNSSAKATKENKENRREERSMEYEGVWFATIKGEKVSIQFKSDDENEFSDNSTSFSSVEFEGLKANSQGPFTLKREAGTMLLTGKFEGEQGMGKYKFTPDPQYVAALEKQGIETLTSNDKIVFFFIDIKVSYVEMLKKQGYEKINKMDLIPLVALKVDEAYIAGWKTAGYKDISLRDLIPLKSLKIDQAYAKEIKEAGFKEVTAHQLISFKAQGIDAKYIAGLKKSNAFKGKDEPTPNDVMSFKAMNVDEEFVKKFADAGYTDIPSHQLVALKSQNITPEYIKGFEAVGMKDIPVSQVMAFKSLGVTPEYVKHFADLGYKLSAGNITAAKSLGITEEFIRSYESAGFKNIPMNDIITLKSQNIPASSIKAYQDLGFADVSIHQIISAKSMGVTPDFIQSMKQKGHDLKSLQKYIQLKHALD